MFATVATFSVVRSARCEPSLEGGGPPVPEPLLTETVTDIDGCNVGEFEVELNGSELGSLHGGAFSRQTSAELEWLTTRRFGLRLEPTFSRSVETPRGEANSAFVFDAAVSGKILQDTLRQIYVQGEVAARLPWTTERAADPGDSALPLVFDVRSALRRSRWTLRGSVGAAAGGRSERIPLRGSAAILTGFGASERYGFWGLEADVDATRKNPTVLALNLVPQLAAIGFPCRLGLAIPWVIGAGEARPSTGIFLRILFESAREHEYGENGD